MIKVKRLNNKDIIINADLIELVEETPDTIITLTNGHKYLVMDSTEEIVVKIIEYKKKTYAYQVLNNIDHRNEV